MKTVIEMAREASDPDKVDPWRDGFWILTQEELERFASLVRADEREACADIVEDEIKRTKPVYSPTADIILRRIRERGQA